MEALKFASSAGFMQWAERVVNEKDQTYGRALIGKQTWTYGDGYRVETKWGQKGGTVLSSLKYMLSTATEAMEHSRDAQIVKDIDARSGVVLTIGWSRQATTDD